MLSLEFDLISDRDLADFDKDYCLNFSEFCIAMFLVNAKLTGGIIPAKLPDSLLNSVERLLATVSIEFILS